MVQVMSVFSWIMANWQIVVGDVVAILTAIIALCTIIPKVNAHISILQSIVDFLKKINVGTPK